VKKLCDELDFQRAVLAYQHVDPFVAMNEINIGFKQLSGRELAIRFGRVPGQYPSDRCAISDTKLAFAEVPRAKQ
jgi:hypothetical protein